MKFSTIAQSFSCIEDEQSRLIITQYLAEIFAQATPEEASMLGNLVLGQLNPPYVGTQFDLAQKTLIPLVAQLVEKSIADIKHLFAKTGDLGAVVWELYHGQDQGMSLEQVFAALHELEQVSGTGSVERKQHLLLELLRTLDTQSAGYVVRVVLGKLRLGFSDMTVLDALSWMIVGNKSLRKDLEHAYNVCADLGAIAETLKAEGIEAIKAMQVRVGIPIRPAAAERLPTARAIVEKLGPCIAQPKLDGFRVQVHVDNRVFPSRLHFFSRNLKDMSDMFPDIGAAVRALPCESAIFEGEAIAYDPNTGNFLPFQQTVKRRRKHDISDVSQAVPLRLFVFDLLYLNGTSVITQGNEQRRKQYLSLIGMDPDAVIQAISERYIETVDELQVYFNECISAGLEGVVVKRPHTPYTPGARNFNWIKLKRQQKGHIEDTIDAVILGYYHGRGKRASFGIGAFLVGVYNADKDLFETIAKVGTGMTDEQWRTCKKKADAIRADHQPNNVVCAPELVPDVWVYPELVAEIAADEISQSPLHTAGRTEEHNGYALRFPRFISYRIDKGAHEATTTKEVVALYKDQF